MQPRDLVAFDLKTARKERKLSQLQTAEMLCTTQPTISRWEAEGTTPAIVRKAWNQHWELEDLKNGNTKGEQSDNVCASAGKDRLFGVFKGVAREADGGIRNIDGVAKKGSARTKGTPRSRRKVSGRMDETAYEDA